VQLWIEKENFSELHTGYINSASLKKKLSNNFFLKY